MEIHPCFVLHVKCVTTRRVSFFIGLRNEAKVMFVSTSTISTPIRRPSPIAVRFFFIVRDGGPTIRPLHDAIGVVVHVKVQYKKGSVKSTTVNRPTLPFVRARVRKPYGGVHGKYFPFTIGISRGVLFFFFHVTRHRVTVRMFTRSASTPFTVDTYPTTCIGGLTGTTSS